MLAGNCSRIAACLASINWSGFWRSKLIPLYARPLSGAPVRLPESDEKLDGGYVVALNGRSSVIEVIFPEPISTPTLTSQREVFGEQKVADAAGVGTYEKNQNTTGLNCGGWAFVHVSGGLEPMSWRCEGGSVTALKSESERPQKPTTDQRELCH